RPSPTLRRCATESVIVGCVIGWPAVFWGLFGGFALDGLGLATGPEERDMARRGGDTQPQSRGLVPRAPRGARHHDSRVGGRARYARQRAGRIDLLVGRPLCVASSKSGSIWSAKRQGRDPKADLLEEI